MTRPFLDMSYIYPPRPATGVHVRFGDDAYKMWMEFEDAIGEFKLNGQRNGIYISPRDDIELWGRHGEQHRKYQPSLELLKAIRALPYPRGKWNVLDSELLHKKLRGADYPQFKHRVYMYDVLVWGGEYLLGETLKTRHGLLETLTDQVVNLQDETLQPQVFRSYWLKPSEWAAAWKWVEKYPWNEGLVLKRTGHLSRLQVGSKEENNGGWSNRMRLSDL